MASPLYLCSNLQWHCTLGCYLQIQYNMVQSLNQVLVLNVSLFDAWIKLAGAICSDLHVKCDEILYNNLVPFSGIYTRVFIVFALGQYKHTSVCFHCMLSCSEWLGAWPKIWRLLVVILTGHTQPEEHLEVLGCPAWLLATKWCPNRILQHYSCKNTQFSSLYKLKLKTI